MICSGLRQSRYSDAVTEEKVATSPAPLVWIDMEMSGLDPSCCKILEIATLVTDGDLNELSQGPNLVVHQPESVLGAMDEWCTRQHGDSGLTEAVRASTIDEAEAERQTLAFIQQWTGPRASPLCGSSVFQDRRFIIRYLPALYEYLHYRLVDVASVRELSRRWHPQLRPPAKRDTHRALDDVRESVEELRFYRTHLFV